MEYSNRRIREVIEDCIHLARDREILCARLIDGVTIEKLAEIHDMSTSQRKRMQNHINALQLQAATSNVLRFPNAWTYAGGVFPPTQAAAAA